MQKIANKSKNDILILIINEIIIRGINKLFNEFSLYHILSPKTCKIQTN